METLEKIRKGICYAHDNIEDKHCFGEFYDKFNDPQK